MIDSRVHVSVYGTIVLSVSNYLWNNKVGKNHNEVGNVYGRGNESCERVEVTTLKDT